MDKTTAAMMSMQTMLECYGFEHHQGQVMPNTDDIETHLFISDDKKYVILVVLSEAGKEGFAAIRGGD